ncbi:MAG TPA: glycogen/starch synthase, partial [Pseudoxanthomonas sp.]|nr:glycogen/starch synthase [Pseudoxanthomonas sp.]
MSLQAMSAPRRNYRRDARGRFLPAPQRVAAPAPRRVLFVAPEMTDFVKTGGLGDVAAALPRALRDRADVRVLIPGYPAVLERGTQLRVVGRVGGRAAIPPCALGVMQLPDGLPVYVLLNPTLYARPGTPYSAGGGADWDDNAVRFAALSHAAAEIAAGRAGLAWRPEVLHLNDWPGALAAAYVRWDGTPAATVLTVHNLAYQGLFPLAQAAALGVPAGGLDDAAFHGRFSMLRAGLVHADQVNTVSHSYAREITTEAHGCGLHALLAGRAASGCLSGIVNGIDAGWDPERDPHLAAPFAIDRWQGKRTNAR